MPNFIEARSTAQQAFASAEARHNFLVGTVPILFQKRNFSTPCTFGRFLTKKVSCYNDLYNDYRGKNLAKN